MTTETEQATRSHTNASLSRTVIRGSIVRKDPDWMPAIQDTLAAIAAAETPADAARAVDEAMMRGAHAAHRCDAIHDLGVQAYDSTNPARRLAWRLVGQHRAARRAQDFNQESAAIAAEEG